MKWMIFQCPIELNATISFFYASADQWHSQDGQKDTHLDTKQGRPLNSAKEECWQKHPSAESGVWNLARTPQKNMKFSRGEAK